MACVELPKDAEGREIPLDAKYVYTRHGKALDVIGFCLMETDGGAREWTVWTKVAKYRAEDVLAERPDSWEHLIGDLRAVSKARCGICVYMNPRNVGIDTEDSIANCRVCPIYVTGDENARSCDRAFANSIIRRIVALRGEGE